MPMAMTLQEREQFKKMEEKIDLLESQFSVIEKRINSIFSMVRGIAIGLVIGGIIFGFLQVKELLHLVK